MITHRYLTEKHSNETNNVLLLPICILMLLK